MRSLLEVFNLLHILSRHPREGAFIFSIHYKFKDGFAILQGALRRWTPWLFADALIKSRINLNIMEKELFLYRAVLGLTGSTILLILRSVGSQIRGAFKKRQEEKHLAKLYRNELKENRDRMQKFADSIHSLAQKNTGGFGINLPPYSVTSTVLGGQIMRLLEPRGNAVENFIANLRAIQFFEKLHTDYHKMNLPAMNWGTHPNTQYDNILTQMGLLEQIELTTKCLIKDMDDIELGSKAWQLVERCWVSRIIFFAVLITTFTIVPSEID